MARTIASSTQSSVLVINGPELSSAYHGETESKLCDVFKQAREKSPCIVVLDEVDALVRAKEGGRIWWRSGKTCRCDTIDHSRWYGR